MKHAQRNSVLGVGVLSAAMITGCGDSRPQAELSPYAFTHPPLIGPAATTRPTPLTHAPKLVHEERQLIPQVTNTVSLTPSTAPATQPVVGASSGSYQTIGGVVAEVNGVPIYANKVLRTLRAELAARASDLDANQFRTFATQEITRKISGLERDELVFGAAERNLSEEDRRLAEFLTMQWRTRQITEAGGSTELAERKAESEGFDFDYLVFDQYRRYMTEVYYRKKVVPRIQISADDIRHYYTANLEKEFTDRAEVTFRLIKIDVKRNGGREAAEAKAKQVAQMAKSGKFAEVASAQNDDARLAKSEGLEAPVEKHAYRLEKVEAAMWEAPLKQVVGPIEDGAAFYVALVESRKEATVSPFDDAAVQDKIYKTLWGQQFRTLTDAIEKKLRDNSMVRDSKAMFETAIQMAMQNYSRWNKGELDME